MRVAQIDVVYDQGSTGKIVSALHRGLVSHGFQSMVFFGRGQPSSDLQAVKVSYGLETLIDAALSRVSGYTGCFSPLSTRNLISELERYQPDIVHLHELHGYFINYTVLLEYLIDRGIPIVWTMHSEYAFTGRCGFTLGCDQWKTECIKCPTLESYPVSYYFDRSREQFKRKRAIASKLNSVLFVSVSSWLCNRIKQSIFKDYPSTVVHNGIDTTQFFFPSDFSDLIARHRLDGRYVVLSVAPDLMSPTKGGHWVLELAKRLRNEPIHFVMIGVKEKSIDAPDNVIILPPIYNQRELAKYYSLADIFLITSQSETFSLTTAESLACGTPVFGFDCGGPTEVAPEPFGHFVPFGNIDQLTSVFRQVRNGSLRIADSHECVLYARTNYSEARMVDDYLAIYQQMFNAETPVTTRDSICSRCIMDTSDPGIKFDRQGNCDYCNNFDHYIRPNWNTGAKGELALQQLAAEIRADGKGREFDCIIGLSGGLDSSYAAYAAKEKMGLRPLLFHVDAGWNTDQAVGNIEKLVDGLGLDLYTDVVNWEAVKRMQVAFLRAGIADLDLVQDAAFFSGLYKFARQYKIKHVFTGSNYSTECCREPEEWGGYLGIDTMLFNDIWRKCGDGKPNDGFPLVDILVYKLVYQKLLGMKMHYPLNYVPYVKKDAEDELERRFGWQRFQHKHHESRFTRFYEDYWLPRRFGYEKRRAHFSSLIMTGQMTRQEALDRISRPEMDENFLKQEFEYVAHKLGLTVDELQQLFELPKQTYHDYRNKHRLIGLGANFLRRFGMERRFFR
jgi:N-acetyl sugar amidotransferase